MYAIKRQLRIWKHELYQLWDKLPFLARVLVGAAVSIGFSVWFGKEYIQPLTKQVTTISKGLEIPENLDPEKDEEIIMNKDKAKNLQPAIKRTENELDANKKKLDILAETVRFEVVNAIQSLFARCGLKVIAEQSLDEAYLLSQETAKKTVSKKMSKSKVVEIKKVETATSKLLTSKEYQYKVVGQFRQIQAFLLLANSLKWRFQLSDIKLHQSKDSYGLLELEFKLSIYYFK